MKTLLGNLALSSLLLMGIACNKHQEMQKEDAREDIQREDAIGVDDIRETNGHDRSIPVEEEEVYTEDEKQQ